ncbi:GNAT family N-acetyltransferase [Kribbella sp. VKM Ac-2568]|uniref:GNAT family N-acetyltransferase n=1 Tax=Kribbella sp. VKM Ac-2568 TaxID=2512219 RepID=UPI0010497DD3|nr:GNAT family N-acetyltransferase [Kribbella sp. VKM Ac-2568]TCM47878.1 ribosomal protein S18 acetylase RimI-like enzyme [Kribbella sp. VKM Ac-2568]
MPDHPAPTDARTTDDRRLDVRPGDVRVSTAFDVRAARPDDLYGAAVARVASWHAAFTGLVPQDFLDAMDPAKIAASWADSITAGRSRMYVAAAVAGGEIVGYAGVGPERDADAPEHVGELYALFVHPDWWGSGAARVLTDAAVTDLRAAGCDQVWLWVLEANTRAHAFYRRYGFTETPDRTHSSLNDLQELRLRLQLRPEDGGGDRAHT